MGRRPRVLAMVAPDAQWHIDRRKEVLKKFPDTKGLDGVFWGSAPCILFLVGVQWYIWTLVNEIPASVLGYAAMGVIAWVNSTTIFYMLSTFIHENSHGLILGMGKNNRLAAACLIELGFCSFVEQWEYTVVHYTMHHPQLNDQAKDSECPAEGHVAVLPEGPMKYIVPFVELFPLGTLLTQGQLSNNAQHTEKLIQDMAGPRNVLMAVSVAVYGVLIYFQMYHAALFAAWTTSLYSSRWCISLHGQSISEHYRHNFVPGGKELAPTHSTYYWLENFVGFNTGYHDEHHTFPNVPWIHLPKLKAQSPDVFNNVNDRRYLALWWEWASHGFETTRFRICHNPAKAK